MKYTTLTLCFFYSMLPLSAQALVLCVSKGSDTGAVVEGSQVVARTSCNAKEFTLTPVTIQDNGDVLESYPTNRAQSVGSNSTASINGNSSTTIGGSATSSIGADEAHSIGVDSSVAIGRDRAVAIGNNDEISIGVNRRENIGGSSVTIISNDTSLTVGKNLTTSVSGDSAQTVTKDLSIIAGRKILIEGGDEITLKSGLATIMLRKNGDVMISGRRINMKSRGVISLKGSKIDQN